MTRATDMTTGNPFRLLIRFSLPLLFGNMFQQMYSMVDTAVVGRVEGVGALASMGAVGWLDCLVLWVVTGFAAAFSIEISQQFGAGNIEKMKKAICMAALMSAVLAVTLTAVSLSFLRPALQLLGTPENIIDGSQTYSTIIFSGLTVIISYNLLASILRAIGDSKTPLVAMIIASLVNVCLDLLFVAVFHWGIAGAAFATMFAQISSCIYCLTIILRSPLLKLSRANWSIDKQMLRRLFKLGAPLALQNIIIACGGLVLQSHINSFGYIFVAGVTAGIRMVGLMQMASISFGSAVSTYVGQNLGARNYDRIRKGVTSATKLSLIVSTSLAIICLLAGKWLLRLFVSGDAETVAGAVGYAYEYLTCGSIMLFALYLISVYRSALQGLGDTVIPMFSGFVELAFRLTMVFILPHFIYEWGIYCSEVSAWFASAVMLGIFYFLRAKKLGKDPEPLESEA